MIQIKKESIEAVRDTWDKILNKSHLNNDYYLHFWVDKEGHIQECLSSHNYTEDLILSFENDQILSSDKWEII